MNILAVGCHPDDLEIGCGGTLAMYVLRGDNVIMCHVANGNRGHKEIPPDRLRDIRIKEAINAGKVIGAKEVINLDAGDLEVDSSNKKLVNKLVDVIRYSRPDIIITHSPNDYMKDHKEVSKMVFDASFSSSVPSLASKNAFYDTIAPIYYMDTLAGIDFNPTEYVDISGTIDIKKNALLCHESQIKWLKEHDGVDFIDFIETISKFRGYQCGVRYAEGFRICSTWPRLVTKRLLP